MTDISQPRGPAAGSKPARFVAGSILRHILVMTGTSAIGLMAIFVGDLANIFFLGWLGDVEILAAVGYAGTLLFLATSVGIGLSITTSALVAPPIGAGDIARARRLATNALLVTAFTGALVALLMWPFVGAALAGMGATGRTAELATTYLHILLPSLPMLAVGMSAGAVLRSLGDARRSMNVTLSGAVVNIILDPLLIFTFGLGLKGAAIASVLARITFLVVGLWGVIGIHRIAARPNTEAFLADAPAIAGNAIPAVLTNVATPFAIFFVTMGLASFGDAAIAAWAVIGRINPVVFGPIFALSGSIGPIVGQNLGAGDFGRCRLAMQEAIKVTLLFTLAAWIVLVGLSPWLVRMFDVHGDTARLVLFNCYWVAPLWTFLGILFVANAVFNTTGVPHYATAFNWGRASLGTIPLVWLGGKLAGAPGVLFGSLLGAVPFGLAAVWVAWRQIGRLEREKS